jgi:hypothetical protein
MATLQSVKTATNLQTQFTKIKQETLSRGGTTIGIQIDEFGQS